MKKTLLLAIMCVFALFGNVKAQTGVEIGADKNHTASYGLPTYDFFREYSVSQQIYTEEDFSDNFGAIKSISFNLANAAPSVVTRQYEIYMKHTDRESMVGSFDSFSAEDLVFDGNVEFPNAKGWLTIPFNKKNFDYSGGNVTVLVYDKTGYKEATSYHSFYTYATDQRMAVTNGSAQPFNPLDKSTMATNSNQLLYMLNYVKFEMESKAIVKAEPASLDLGETMLGNYWGPEKKSELNIKVVATTVKDIKVDNDFFVIPAMEDIDFTADPVVIEVSYDKNATIDGEVKGNITISYEDTEVVVPVTANAYTPGETDVWELAKEIKFENNTYKDTPAFDKLHDNYLLPRESATAVTPDIVYSFELEKETILRAKVEGANAKMAIYNEDFNGKGGPANDNNAKGNILITSEFFFDFNEDVLTGWAVKAYNNTVNNWELTENAGPDGSKAIISYSYRTSPYPGYEMADNIAITEKTYRITENSKLSFDAMCDVLEEGTIDHVNVEVSKDGENTILIEKVAPTSGKFTNNVVDLGAKFAELGLEYSDYHIVLRHKEEKKFYVCVDNIRLSNVSEAKTRAASDVDEIYAVEYPAGKYYLVAAAEDQIAFEISILNAEELPATPTNLVATTIDEFSIELEWNSAERATSYNIYRNDEFLVNVTDTTYIDENLDSDVDYCYVVKAYNDILESVASEKACAKTLKVVLTPPTEITAEATSETTIVLTWSKVEKVGGYKIYWGEDVVEIVTDTTYTVEGLTPATDYCYTVASVYKARESFDRTDFACATTLAIVPAVPANVKVEGTSASSVKVSWDEAENAKRYYIYSADTLVAKTAYEEYNIVGLESDKEYCFTVTAVNEDVESEASEEACGKTLSNEGIVETTMTLNVYPNPVNDKLYIETESNIETINIYTLTGIVVLSETNSTNTIDVSNLSSGVYFVKVRTENSEVVRRIVKK